MVGRTTKFGTEPPQRPDDFTDDELPDDQVVRRFFASHEREARHGDKRRRKPAAAADAPDAPRDTSPDAEN